MSEIGFDLTQLHKLIYFIIENLDRRLGAIELAKIVYLVDVENMRFLGETLTSGEYVREKMGPLHGDFYRAIEDMDGYEVHVSVERRLRQDKHNHMLGEQPRFEAEFDPKHELIIRKVLEKVQALRPRAIERLAYETEPMKRIIEEEGAGNNYLVDEPIDFSVIDLNERLAHWRKNRAAYIQEPDHEYEAYLEEERELAEEIFAA